MLDYKNIFANAIVRHQIGQQRMSTIHPPVLASFPATRDASNVEQSCQFFIKEPPTHSNPENTPAVPNRSTSISKNKTPLIVKYLQDIRMWGDFVADMVVADVVETQEVAAIDQYDRQVEEQCAINQMGQDALYDNVVYDQYAQEVAYDQYAQEEIVQQEYQEEVVDQQIRQAYYNREAEIVQQEEVADAYGDPYGGYAQRTLAQQQDYNFMEANRIDRQEYVMDRNVQREDFRDQRQINREEGREVRQDYREDRRIERQDQRAVKEVQREDFRVDRREERQEFRDERQVDRWEQRELKQDNREVRRDEREDYRQDRRIDREENREERNIFRQDNRMERREDRQVRREDRTLGHEERRQQRQEVREDREVNRWDRKQERQENRQDREVNRWQRKQDREVNKQERREGRQQRRQDREANRWERKQEREQNREVKHQDRQIKREERKQGRQVRREDRQVRREERKEGREERRQQRRQEKAQHKQNELRGKYEVQNAQRFESPLFYHHFFEWKEGMGNLAGGQVVIGERSMRLGQVSKMKLMKQLGVNNTRKVKISHMGGDLLFSVQSGRAMNGLPLHYMWFARVVTEKMQLKGCDLNNSYVPERRFTNQNAASPIIDGILYKQSQYLKTWQLRYVAISPDGLCSYKDETGGESFTIKRDTTTEIWTRFDIHEQMLVIKVHHAGRKTEFGIPIVDYTRLSDKNWLLAFYRLLFPF